MALDSTGLRKVRKGIRVMCGPFLFEVVKVTTSAQAWLRIVPPDGSPLLTRPCGHLTVYDDALQPAGPAEIPLMEIHDHDHASHDHE